MGISRKYVITSPRLSGSVKRWHTWPTIQQQTVADHCYHCMRIWYQIWGPLLPDITSYFLWHDSGEVVTGDIPYPFKKDNPRLKQMFDVLEEKAIREMGGPDFNLSKEDLDRIRFCELCERREFCMIEEKLGNTFAQPVIAECDDAISTMLREHPDWNRLSWERKI